MKYLKRFENNLNVFENYKYAIYKFIDSNCYQIIEILSPMQASEFQDTHSDYYLMRIAERNINFKLEQVLHIHYVKNINKYYREGGVISGSTQKPVLFDPEYEIIFTWFGNTQREAIEYFKLFTKSSKYNI